MRKVLSKLALAAAALAGASTSANAFILLTLQDTGATGTTGIAECNTALAVSALNCGTGFTIINTDNVLFNGTVGNFTVTNSSGFNNFPGNTDEAFVANSTTNVQNNLGSSTGLDSFYVNVRSFGFLLPAGEEKTFFGSASLTSTSFAAGDQVSNRFSVDPDNAGGLVNLLFCTDGPMTIQLNNSCNTGAPIIWQDPNTSAVGFSIRSEQFFTMTGGSRVGTTSTATVSTVPEPVTTALVGVALLGMALASRRRSTKAQA